MDVAALSTAMSTSSIQSQISVAVLDKTMDANENLGAGLVRMIDSAAMERSVNPHIGSNFDLRI